MPTPLKLKAPFYSEAFYHIVCKSIDGLLLFPSEEDYVVFIERFKKFTDNVFEVWSFCLLPNHSHYIIKVKDAQNINACFQTYTEENKTVIMKAFLADPENESLLNNVIERQMNSFLVSYANYYNNKYLRKGGLFQQPFKRIQVHDDSHLQQAIIYCNANAQKHQIVKDFKEYKYSSYHNVIANDNYYIASNNVIQFFGNREKFINAHKEQVDYFYKHDWPSSKLE